jgi:membrane protein implicated in regulation of membrane protease activity
MTTLLFIKKYWKQISFILAILSVVVLIWTTYTFYNKIKQLQKDLDRMETNLINSNNEVKQLKDKNGNLFYENQSLVLTKDELKEYNQKLVKEVEDLKIKLKNVLAIAQIQYIYDYCIDSIPVYYEKPYYIINYDTTGLHLYSKLNTLTNKLDSTKITVSDSLTLVWGYQTKGWWIFKRKVGIKLVFQNTNPFLKLNGMQSYYLIDFKRKNKENIWY